MESNRNTHRSQDGQNVHLGSILTAILFVVYFGFVALGAFAPKLLIKPVLHNGTVTWAFAYGLFIIVLGVVLTGLYVLVVNRAEARLTGE